jgi:hypothetical protein
MKVHTRTKSESSSAESELTSSLTAPNSGLLLSEKSLASRQDGQPAAVRFFPVNSSAVADM